MADTITLPKFSDPDVTAKGEPRAHVSLKQLETLWLNTGTLCNIACENCYIQSTPKNDSLVYLTRDEAYPFIDEALSMGAGEIGITGGEPFMNPDILGIIEDGLAANFNVLVLTNAMRPMMRPRMKEGLLALSKTQIERLTLRISLDHYSAKLHDEERGEGAFETAMDGVRWLSENGFKLAIAGRTMWNEDEDTARRGYAQLIKDMSLSINPDNSEQLVLFPEMKADDSPPEITTACWGILDKSPNSVMCSSTRMVVKRKGAAKPAVLACTLLAYDERFELGETLKEASRPVALNHPWCATFCVLGGASCS